MTHCHTHHRAVAAGYTCAACAAEASPAPTPVTCTAGPLLAVETREEQAWRRTVERAGYRVGAPWTYEMHAPDRRSRR